ncbi:Signal-peptide peptidase, presenilin aspartyl protease [uncultured archaeon]|nr:Signal-peptide peptidase, presenilin aspartyl protease [uncultured archaeon]
MDRSFFSNPLNQILLLFIITQGLGLACGLLLLSASAVNPDVQYISIAPTGQADDPLNAFVFIGYVLFGAAVAILAIRFIKRKFAFRLLEFAMLGGSVSVVFLALLNGILHMDFWAALGLAGTGGLAFAVLKFFVPQLKNTAAVLSSAGVAALFGFSLGFWPAVLFVLGLSLYDYIAVFKTRHMLQLAQHLGEKDLSFTITAESKTDEKEKPPLRAPGSVQSPGPNAASRPTVSRSSSAPAASFSTAPPAPIDRLDLGSGDLAVPAMLAVSTSTIAGPLGALAVAVGTTVSLYFTLHFVTEKRVALPALPPICLGGLGALLLFLLARALFGF